MLTVTLAVAMLAAACGSDDPRDRALGDTDHTVSTASGASDGTEPSTDTSASTTSEQPAPSTHGTSAPSTTGATSLPAPGAPRTTTTKAAVPPPAVDPRVARVTAADLGASWHAGCPVGPADLRWVTVTYVGFDGADHEGALVVHADAVPATLKAFDRLRNDRFPIRKIVPVDRYGGSDDASMADDNTSAFNCRVSTGSSSTWSQHAYGRAVDVNPLENPYVSDSSVQPPAGAGFLDRSDVRTGMAVAGGDLVTAFAAAGWGWGGNWHSVKDYQHFSATGR